MLTVAQLVGTWSLEKWVVHVGEDDPRMPFGSDAFGRITYTADGYMWAVLQSVDRPRPDVRHLSAASVSDQAAMAAGYLSYGGRYSIDAAQVVHRVDFSLFTPWLGTSQRRDVVLSSNGNALVLATPPASTRNGRPLRNELHWQRLSGA